MTTKTQSTRRFFLKGGALAAAPLAGAVPAAAGEDGQADRLKRLEDEAAIRELHQTWLRHINAGAHEVAAGLCTRGAGMTVDESIRRIAPEPGGETGTIDLTADGETAAGRFPCAVTVEDTIPADCTLAQMARAQGGGVIRRTETRLLRVDYVKTTRGWAIAGVTFTTA